MKAGAWIVDRSTLFVLRLLPEISIIFVSLYPRNWLETSPLYLDLL